MGELLLRWRTSYKTNLVQRASLFSYRTGGNISAIVSTNFMPGEYPTNGPVDSTFASEGLGSFPGILATVAKIEMSMSGER